MKGRRPKTSKMAARPAKKAKQAPRRSAPAGTGRAATQMRKQQQKRSPGFRKALRDSYD